MCLHVFACVCMCMCMCMCVCVCAQFTLIPIQVPKKKYRSGDVSDSTDDSSGDDDDRNNASDSLSCSTSDKVV